MEHERGFVLSAGLFIPPLPYSGFISSRGFLFATAMGHSSTRTFYYVLSLSESSEPC